MNARLLFALLLVAFLTACGNSGATTRFQSTDVTGVLFARDFSLIDHTGQRRTLADFKGKVVVLFFGYTHCPDVCPTTLNELALALKKIGAQADKVQVLFVTVDPERDDRFLLAQYVPAFNPTFLGLYGTLADTARTAQEFKIVYEKQGSGANYAMDHSTGTYIYDPLGRLRLFVGYERGVDVFVHDIRALLENAQG